MKEQIKEKLDKRIEYILSKDVRDITNEEYDILKDKLTNIKSSKIGSDGAWLFIFLLIFATDFRNRKEDDE